MTPPALQTMSRHVNKCVQLLREDMLCDRNAPYHLCSVLTHVLRCHTVRNCNRPEGHYSGLLEWKVSNEQKLRPPPECLWTTGQLGGERAIHDYQYRSLNKIIVTSSPESIEGVLSKYINIST
jgi:hypothetical protein